MSCTQVNDEKLQWPNSLSYRNAQSPPMATVMENHTEKNVETEIESGIMQCSG